MNLSGGVVWARASRASQSVHGLRRRSGAGDRRHHRLIAVVANAHRDAPSEVDAVDVFEKAVDEMLPRLLAVGDDVDAGIFLQLQRKHRRIALGLAKRVAIEPPGRPEFARLRQPSRLRQAAGDRCLQQQNPLASKLERGEQRRTRGFIRAALRCDRGQLVKRSTPQHNLRKRRFAQFAHQHPGVKPQRCAMPSRPWAI